MPVAPPKRALDMSKILLKPPPRLAKDVIRQLAHFVVSSNPGDLPEKVRKEASRTLLNWMGCAIGGSRQGAVTSPSLLAPFAGSGQASLAGRASAWIRCTRRWSTATARTCWISTIPI